MKKSENHSLIAISGKPGAGKTSVSKELLHSIPNLVYFDFGAFFRPLALYLVKYKGISIEQLKRIVSESKIDKLMSGINIGYRNNNGEYQISINGNFFSCEELYNPEMDKLTVDVGTCFGDNLNNYIESIISDIRKRNPVLLNARRPFSVCTDISNHIFLQADFHKRAKRKSELDGISLEEARKYLQKRDAQEQNAGFWEIHPFTKVIDTTNLEVSTTAQIVIDHIMSYSIPKDINSIKKEEPCHV